MKLRNYQAVLLIAASIIILGCGQKKARWMGTIQKEGEVVIIKNPKKPMYQGKVLRLEKELIIGGEKVPEEGAFSSIGASASLEIDDEGNIYILSPRDSAVFVYDSHGNFLRKFGRPGQGPGELGPAQSIFVSGDTVIVNCLDRKISCFTRNGDFLGSFSTKGLLLYFTRSDRAGNIYGFEAGWLTDQPAVRLLKLDRDMNLIVEIASYPMPEPNKPLDPFDPFPYWEITPEGMLVFSRPEIYALEFYNPDGKLVRQVTRAYSLVKITDEEKEKRQRDFSGRVQFRREYHPGFGRFICDDKGRLMVQTFERSAEGSYFHDIFDEQGRYMAKVPLKGTLLAGKNDKLYCSDEDENGFTILIRYGMKWNFK